MIKQLITQLADGKFHSGQILAQTLGTSRTTISKQLAKLEQVTGLVVQKVHGRGYRLESPLCLLNESTLNHATLPWPIKVYDTIDSTNTECSRLLATHNITSPLVITAEQQTQGKGRRGRTWVSPYGQNLYYSLLLTLKNGAQQLEGLSLTVGLAVLKTIQSLTSIPVGLKWPNDLLINDKKISGILLELNGDPSDICHVTIGIGLNINMQTSSEDINQPWTSLRQETGQLIDRNTLIITLTNTLNDYLTKHFTQGFSALQNEWEHHNLWQNKTVYLLHANQQISGIMLGVNQTGALKLKVNNEIQHFNAGEVSLRLTPSNLMAKTK